MTSRKPDAPSADLLHAGAMAERIRCACLVPDAYDCAINRYGINPIDGVEPCECPCHDEDEEDDA